MTEMELIEKAKEALKYAYVPYSRFRVGAALEASDGTVFTGCNVENSAYPNTYCAERTALVKAVSEGYRKFTRIAIVAEKAMPYPCGACRQSLLEFAPDLEIIVHWNGKTEKACLRDMLSFGFGANAFPMEENGEAE